MRAFHDPSGAVLASIKAFSESRVMGPKAGFLLRLYKLRIERLHSLKNSGFAVAADGLHFCEEMVTGLEQLDPEEICEIKSEALPGNQTRASCSVRGRLIASMILSGNTKEIVP